MFCALLWSDYRRACEIARPNHENQHRKQCNPRKNAACEDAKTRLVDCLMRSGKPALGAYLDFKHHASMRGEE